jgi:hypothetical protein
MSDEHKPVKSLFDLAPEVEIVDEFISPEIPQGANPSTVIDRADKTSKIINSTRKALKSKVSIVPGIDAVIEVLMADESLRCFSEPPSLIEVRNDDSYGPVLDELQAIVDKYKQGFDHITADSDVTRMAAFLTDLSQELAIYQSQAQHARSEEKRYRNKAYIKAKKTATEEGARVTDLDAEELSKLVTAELSERAANLEFVEKYLYNSFHSIRNFVELLNFVAGRNRRAEGTGAQL